MKDVTMHDSRIRHLEMVQAVIARLSGNSFAVKSWSIAAVAGLLALAAKDANERFAIVAFLPALAFWCLDSYYLRQERLFRALYDHLRSTDPASPSDFSMKTDDSDTSVESWPATLFTPVVLGSHGPVIATIAAVLLYAHCK